MQLKLKRSQKSGGLMGGKVIFILDARAEPSAEEASLIKKYALGKMNVYDSAARQKHQANSAAHFEGGKMEGLCRQVSPSPPRYGRRRAASPALR